MRWLTTFPGLWVLLALALYGAVGAICQVFRLVRRGIGPEACSPLSLLVLIHNQEYQIEGFIRSLAALVRARPSSVGKCELLLVDLASTDDTPLILERLARQDPHLQLVRLPADHTANALESALFLCHNSLVILADLRGNTNAASVLKTLNRIW